MNLDVNVRVRYTAAMVDKQNTYRIGNVANSLGISQRAVRYYEELGFIHPSRTKGGFRIYSERDLLLIAMVMRFKELGMSLDEIRSLQRPAGDGISREAMNRLRAALIARRDEFEAKITKYMDGIAQIKSALDFLTHCENCCADNESTPCNNCMKGHGEEISPLINPLLQGG